MQDPQAILAAAKSGSVPTTWRILRPTRGYPTRVGCTAAVVAFIAAFFLVFCGAFASEFGRIAGIIGSQDATGVDASSPSTFFNSLVPFSPVVLAAAAALALALVALVGFLAARRAASGVPHSYFVFTPEGAVQATGQAAITAIDYAAIDLINSRVNVTTTTRRDASTGAVLGTSTSVSVSGELHYHDGHTVRFRPANRFGSPESIVQRLINGHQQYIAMVGAPHGGQYPPQSAY